MRDDITSIPISEVFEPKDGCPICRLREMLEERMADYITGAAMMEPDVRLETNRLGFCHAHYRRMLSQRRRLSVALILESGLAEVEKTAFSAGFSGKPKKMKEKAETCFCCHHIDRNMQRFAANICRLWERESDFRRLYAAQPVLCLPHSRLLSEAAEENLPKKRQADFQKQTAALAQQYLTTLREDVSHFCRMFDYRNSGADADWGNSKDAVERAVWFLTGETVD